MRIRIKPIRATDPISIFSQNLHMFTNQLHLPTWTFGLVLSPLATFKPNCSVSFHFEFPVITIRYLFLGASLKPEIFLMFFVIVISSHFLFTNLTYFTSSFMFSYVNIRITSCDGPLTAKCAFRSGFLCVFAWFLLH